MKIYLLSFYVLFGFAQYSWKTPFELGNGNQTPTYEEMITYFNSLANHFSTIQIKEAGTSDDGTPIHYLVFDATEQFSFNTKQVKILVNNNIHPGEPDGVDASMQLLRDLAIGKVKASKNILLVIIPAYNVEGTKNRNSFSRANQNGPEAYGFRGNSKNLDLNRDFIKTDSKNMRTFANIFHQVQPDVFIDNHVSNGADYSYVFTLIESHWQKMGVASGTFFKHMMTPAILKQMEQKKIETIPYVTVYGNSPDKGFYQMMDTPRYSCGYASLFGSFSYLPETHMLKKYADRVEVTYQFMLETYQYCQLQAPLITNFVRNHWKEFTVGSSYPLQWKLDSTQSKTITFKGYEANYIPSKVTGKNRLFYDQSKPYTKQIPYFERYKVLASKTIPKYYVIPPSEYKVLDLIHLQNITSMVIKKDTLFKVQGYYIDDFQTLSQPYEGHYLHSNTKVKSFQDEVFFPKGTHLISTQQPGVKYLMEALEPEAPDSFFNWNFFDSILQQKEGYSAYVFEDIAWELLQSNPDLKMRFEERKAKDVAFADNAKAQLDWIYQNSPYYEKSHKRYPIYRIN